MLKINISPYFSDFDASKNHRMVLFVAGHPLQAREVNNIQRIQMQQQKYLAGHIFKDGSRVEGASIANLTREYVRLASLDKSGVKVDLRFVPKSAKLVGESSGVEAVLMSFTAESSDNPVPFITVNYTKIGKDAQQFRFLPGEEITVRDDKNAVLKTLITRCPTCPGYLDPQDTTPPVGLGTKLITVDEGVYYYDGFFVRVPKGEIIYSSFGERTTCKVGFDVIERIVKPEEDASLYDNALGYPNETAPGADRLVMELVLTKRSGEIADGTRFIEIATIEEGFVQILKSDYQYAALMDTMAQRTYEESGNYTVSNWGLRYREHKAAYEGDPNGFLVNGKEEMLNAVIQPGIGYVKGYRVSTGFDSFINVPKARSTLKSYDGALFFKQGSYVDLVPDESLSAWPNNPTAASIVSLENIQLYDGEPLAKAPTGKVVGHIKIGDATFVGEVNGEKVWRYKVLDFVMNEAATVKCVSSETNRFLATPPRSTQFQIRDYADIDNSLIYELPRNNIKSLRNLDRPDRSSMSIALRRKLSATLDASGSYTFTLAHQNFDAAIQDTIIIVGAAGAYTSIYATSQNCKPAGNTLTLDLGPTHSGKAVTLIHTVHTVGLVEKSKQSVTAFKNSINRTNWDKWINLGAADVYKIESVMAYSAAAPATKEDVTAKFLLDPNITPYAYLESKVKMREGEAISNAFDTIDIKYRYFNHSDPNKAGYFTVDSYSSVLADPDSGVTYATLPAYLIGNKLVSSANILDFRPTWQESGEMPATKMTALFNLEYYAGRRDLMCVDKDGKFFHLFGVPADDPKAPNAPNEDVMPLYEVFIPAYTYSFRDVKLTKIENKRYTMRDIGRLERRIDNLEYYTTLSQLESQAAADNTKDAQGFNRFKNGFVVDDFKKYATGDTSNNEFRATIDRGRGELRPNYYLFNRKAVFNAAKSTNAVLKDGIIIKPYQHVKIDSQPFATRSVSVNPYVVFRREGRCILSPNIDNWSDTNRLPEQNFDIDTGVDAVRKLAERQNRMVGTLNDHFFANRTAQVGENESKDYGLFGKVTNKTTIKEREDTRVLQGAYRDVHSSSTTRPGWRTTVTNTTTGDIRENVKTTEKTSTTTRTQTNATIESRTDRYTFDKVTNVEQIPYMRAVTFEAHATGLYPNTRHYVFFDNRNISDQCSLLGSSDKIKDALAANVLVSDEAGNISISVNIKAGQFFNGVKAVRITNDPNNTKREENETSYAEAQFFAGGIKQDKQITNLNITTPTYKETDDVKETTTTTTQRQEVTQRTVENTRTTTTVSRTPYDPIAQSFKLENDYMISQIELWFETVDAGTDVIVQIRTMNNGYPTTTVLGEVKKVAANIATSWNASRSTVFEFPTPVRVQKDVEYCFVILGSTPLTKVWAAHLGEECVNVPNKVADSQVSLGSEFRSQNGSTWNAEQFEDLMYAIHVAKFENTPMRVHFDISGGLEEDPMESVPFEGEKGSNLIRVYLKEDHALSVGDKVHINCFPNQEYDVQLTNGALVVGQLMEIDNQRTSAKIKAVKYATATKATVTLEKLDGCVKPTSTFLANAYVAKPGKADAYSAYFNNQLADYDVRQAAGTFINVKTPVTLNGIPCEELNGTHLVKRVDDNKTFVIEVDSKSAETGRFGPTHGVIIVNRKADMVNVAANYQLHGSSEKWSLFGHGHGDKGSLFEAANYTLMEAFNFDMASDRYLPAPMKLASVTNEALKLNKAPSAYIKGELSSYSEFLSPVFAEDGLSMTCVSNDIYPLSADAINQDPNGVKRFVDETHQSQGMERFKYVTNTIALKNPAADLKIWFDMYRPAHTDFDIYIKTQPANVTQIDDQPWVKLENIDQSAISSSIDNLVEFNLLLSEHAAAVSGADHLFSAFKVKIVGRSKNSAIPPLFKNLRLIAYT